jgi:hypothetical protein
MPVIKSLLDTTNRLLSEARKKHGSLAKIASQSGGAVDAEWLKKFASGKIGDPSVNRIQSLHDHLVRLQKQNGTEEAA